MSFSDILKEDLPSKKNADFMESSYDDFDDDDKFFEEFMSDFMENDDDDNNDNDELPADREPDDSNKVKSESEDFECGGYGSSFFNEDDDDDDDEDFGIDGFPGVDDDLDDDDDDEDFGDFDDDDIDDMPTGDLAGAAAAIDDDTINRIVGPENPQELSPEEEMQADDMMSVAATPIVLNSELGVDEKKKFIESETEVQIAMNEGFLMESDIHDIAESADLVQENSYNNKMVVRLDKNAKMKQLYAIGINVSAAAHHDPDYYKLKKVNRIRRTLKAKLRKKYHNEAIKRMKIYFKRLTHSRSKTLAKAGKNYKNK